MATLTRNALWEIEREKDFTPEEAFTFLHKRENFMSMAVGLKRELCKRGDCPADNEQLLPYFKEVLKSAGFTKDQRKNADAWLVQDKLPSPHYAIRLCFALGLSGQDAMTFLWNCRATAFTIQTIPVPKNYNLTRRETSAFYNWCALV